MITEGSKSAPDTSSIISDMSTGNTSDSVVDDSTQVVFDYVSAVHESPVALTSGTSGIDESSQTAEDNEVIAPHHLSSSQLEHNARSVSERKRLN